MSAVKFGRRQSFRHGIILVAAIGTGLAILAGGSLQAESIWVTGYDDGSLTEYDLTTGNVVNTGTAGKLTLPDGIAVAPDGSIYVSNGGAASISHFSSTGVYIGDVVIGGGGSLRAPAGLRFDSSGHLYVSDNAGDAIQEFNLSTVGVTTTATLIGTPITGLVAGGGIAFGPSTPLTSHPGPNNTLYAGSFVNGNVLKSGSPSPVALTVGAPISGVLFLPSGSVLVSNLFGNNVLQFNPDNSVGVFTTFPDVPVAMPPFFDSYSPADLRLDPATGNVFVDLLGYSQDPTNPDPHSGSIEEFHINPDGSVSQVTLPGALADLLSPSDFDFVPNVPEPSSLVAVIGVCGMGLIAYIRRRRSTADRRLRTAQTSR